MEQTNFNLEKKTKSKFSLLFWENILVTNQMSAFGWKCESIGKKEVKEEYYEDELVEDRYKYKVYDAKTKEHIGSFDKTVTRTEKVKKERVTVFRWYNFVRVTPFCQDSKFNAYEKYSNIINKIRVGLLFTCLFLLLFNLINILGNSGHLTSNVFSDLLPFFFILYLLATTVNIILFTLAKERARQLGCKDKILTELKRRLDCWEQAYNNNSIGYDAYEENTKVLNYYISCL